MSDIAGGLGFDMRRPASRRSALDRVEWQDVLFAADLNRFALLRLGGAKPEGGTLHVYRNHAFEGVASALPAFLEYAGFALEVIPGDYDDSLALPAGPYDAALVWLDFDRYSGLGDGELANWAVGRLEALRASRGGPLIVANSPGGEPRHQGLNAAVAEWAARSPGAGVLKLDELAAKLGDGAFDPARAPVTGTTFADALVLEAARTLVFDLLARTYATPVKALAVDLDHTLYAGVLGEEGVAGVVLTEGHAALQRVIGRLADRGVLVSVVSRNEPSDVEELFACRDDFPLRRDQVASWHVGWSDKSTALAAAARKFNIAAEGFLFIDDNVGELAQVAAHHPEARLLHAGADAAATARALGLYPGLPREGPVFTGRAKDIAANARRAALAEVAVDEAAYLEALGAALKFVFNPAEDLARLAEMSRKTNQFNLALRRFDEARVDRYLREPNCGVVHVFLTDRLADSGSVAAVFLRREDEAMMVEEFCISCRALGRRLESIIASEAIRAGMAKLGGRSAMFDWRRGPRNRPALDWLEAFSGAAVLGEEGRVPAPAERLAGGTQAVAVRWIDA